MFGKVFDAKITEIHSRKSPTMKTRDLPLELNHRAVGRGGVLLLGGTWIGKYNRGAQ